MTLITLLTALLLDWRWGEIQRHHPLVHFGNLASLLEKRWNHFQQQTPLMLKTLGLLAVLLLVILPSLGLQLLLLEAKTGWALPVWIIEVTGLYFCLGRQSLSEHAMAVYQPLRQGYLTAARSQIARIVSRQTASMTQQDISKATVESVLENANDACFATLFWFVIGGLPVVILHRLSNTLDAMWGYKTERYLHFGWAAARLDDLLNWIPARLGALSFALLGNRQKAFHCWKRQAPLYDSPNGGVIMATGAGALNIQLGGDAIYHDQIKARPILGSGPDAGVEDIPRALNLLNRSIILWLLAVALVQWVLYW